MWEFQAESLYLHHIYSTGGCRGPHYTPIFASGPNAAILHYGHAGAPNSRQMAGGELLLVDAGADYYRYSAVGDCIACLPCMHAYISCFTRLSHAQFFHLVLAVHA